MDIAPTALTLFGLPVPAHMDGRTLVGVSETRPTPAKGKKK
jgi:arylsulfatase A-like enzyme